MLDVSSELLPMVELYIMWIEVLMMFFVHIVVVETTMMSAPGVVRGLIVVMWVWERGSTD